MKFVRRALVMAAIVALAACHGGPSGTSFVPSGPPQAQAVDGMSPTLHPEAAAKLKLSVAKLSFTAAGAKSAKKLVATEKGYTGTLTVKNTCSKAKIATIKPTKGKGPKFTIVVTPLASGSCTITVSDKAKHHATAKVSVAIAAPITVTPSTLNFSAVGAASAQTLVVGEINFSSKFAESDTCTGIATVAASSWSGPSASATVTPVAAGQCAVTVSDTNGQSMQVPVVVTTTGIIIQGRHAPGKP